MLRQQGLEGTEEFIGKRRWAEIDADWRISVDDGLEAFKFHRHELGLVVAGVDSAPDDNHGVVVKEMAVVLHRLWEHHDLDGGLKIFESEDRHEVALASPLLLQRGHQATGRAHGAVLDAFEFSDGRLGATTK